MRRGPSAEIKKAGLTPARRCGASRPRACSHKTGAWMFEQIFAGCKAKICSRTGVRQKFLMRQPAKFAEKLCGWAYGNRSQAAVRKKHPPIRSVGEWGVQPLIGLSIGLVTSCFLESAVLENLRGVWVILGFPIHETIFASTCWSRLAQHSEWCFVFGNCL